MKKILLGIGTLATVVVPTVSVVACSAGSVFKSKINSVQEAKDDVTKIFNELKETGTLDSDMDKYIEGFTAKNVLHFEDGIKKEDVIGFNFDISDLTLQQGKVAKLYRDWTATHNDFYSTLNITLSDGTPAYATVFFKYDKTNGIWTTGKKSLLFNVAVGAGNLLTKLKHVISDITISKEKMYESF